MIKVGDYIKYCTNHLLTDRLDKGFVLQIKGNEIEVIHMLEGETKPEHKEYLFNNPIEFCSGWINFDDLK